MKVSVIFRRGEKVMAIEIGGCICQSGKRRWTDFLLKTPKSHGKKLGAKTESLNTQGTDKPTREPAGPEEELGWGH